MKAIYKYPLQVASRQTVHLPAGHTILAIQDQGGVLQMWVLINPDMEETVPVKIRCYGTGHREIDDEAVHHKYLATIQQGIYVWHFFEVY